jgi:methylamine---glutamate N-methyltransferase subunit C
MGEVEDTRANYDICMRGNCSACPSYPDKSGGAEGLYCARGPSKLSVEKKGCNCPECPVWINDGLSGMYYCIKPAGG